MKFGIGVGGWPVNGGALLIPAGTLIDTSTVEWAWLLDGPLAGGAPPPNAQALDQATYNAMVGAWGYHRVAYGPGITPATSGGPRWW